MKKTFFISILLLLSLQAVWCQDTIRIMSINIDQGIIATLDSIGHRIKSYHPDFVAVQEIDMYPHRGNAKHQYYRNFIAELSYFADMQGVFGKAWDHPNGWDYGDGVLSKHAFTKTESFILKHKDKTEPRQILLLHANVKGHSICFCSTHLCHEDSANRAMQLKQIKNIMRKQKDEVQFICGDLNSSPKENIVHPILKGWKDALPDDQVTFSSQKDRWHYQLYKYDYMLYKSNRQIEVIYHTIDCDSSITDHCICVADIVIH